MNGILVIDKEKNKTSRDIVNEVCKKLNTRHIGHTGTLDPIATGVLVLGVNDGCKIINLLTSDVKTYEATILVGTLTDSLDITGNVIEKVEVNNLDIKNIEEVINKFPRKYNQTVPKFSAVHVNGKRLYEYARSDIDVILPSREVNIYELELISDLEKENNDYIFKIRTTVSKGTYIRSLINDIGNMLNIPCTMLELRRTKQGIFDIKDAIKVSDINEDTKLIPIIDCLSNYEKIIVDDIQKDKVKNGQVLNFNTNSSIIIVVDKNNILLAIYKRYDKDLTMMKPFKVFKEKV